MRLEIRNLGSLDSFELQKANKNNKAKLNIFRSCAWAVEKLKSKEIKASQLVRCGLIGSNSYICCKYDSTANTSTSVTDTRTIKMVTDFTFR